MKYFKVCSRRIKLKQTKICAFIKKLMIEKHCLGQTIDTHYEFEVDKECIFFILKVRHAGL